LPSVAQFVAHGALAALLLASGASLSLAMSTSADAQSLPGIPAGICPPPAQFVPGGGGLQCMCPDGSPARAYAGCPVPQPTYQQPTYQGSSSDEDTGNEESERDMPADISQPPPASTIYQNSITSELEHLGSQITAAEPLPGGISLSGALTAQPTPAPQPDAVPPGWTDKFFGLPPIPATVNQSAPAVMNVPGVYGPAVPLNDATKNDIYQLTPNTPAPAPAGTSSSGNDYTLPTNCTFNSPDCQ
jgi:hypothetical protein